MKLNQRIIILFFLLCSVTGNLAGQVFIGSGDSKLNLGYIPSEYSYFTVGTDHGLIDFLSIGANFDLNNFETNSPLGKDKFQIEGRINFHGGKILDLKKIDFSIGYHIGIVNQIHGIHTAFHYKVFSIIQVYARAKYRISLPTNITDNETLKFEVGLSFSLQKNYGDNVDDQGYRKTY